VAPRDSEDAERNQTATYRKMDDTISFKIGAGLSVLSGILYLFARREYAKADAIRNAKHVKISELKTLVSESPQKRVYVKFYGQAHAREPLKTDGGENVAIIQRLILGRGLNLRQPAHSVYPIFRSEDRADWEIVDDASNLDEKKESVRVSYAVVPELETVAEREENVGNKWVSGLFFLLGLKYPIAYIHQTNVLRNNTKLFAVGEVYDMEFDTKTAKRDRNLPRITEQSSKVQETPSTSSPLESSERTGGSQLMLSPLVTYTGLSITPKPFIITRLTEQEVISQIERQGRGWQTWSMTSGLGGVALLIYSLFGSSSEKFSLAS
jgi:hypothetical protein